MILINDEHLKKEPFPIDVTDDVIVSLINDEQLKKELFPIEVTDDGISNVNCSSDDAFIERVNANCIAFFEYRSVN